MCGLVGVVAKNAVNQLLYDGLMVLQHRGQDAAGIVTSERQTFHMHKGPGLVRDVFRTRDMRSLPGNLGIAHCRYPTAGSAFAGSEAQPFYVNSPFGIVLGHNGNLTNSDQLKQEMFRSDLRHINTNSDSEVLLNVLAHELERAATGPRLDPETVFNAVANVHRRVRGAYAIVAMIAGCGVLAFRDPHGIRPLVIGANETELGTEWLVASESVALESLGFRIVRDVAPGEAILFDEAGGFHSRQCAAKAALSPCIFEYVYLARPDSLMDGVSVYEARLHMGEQLAERINRHHRHLDIDVVIPVPDTSRGHLPRGFRQEPLHRPDVHHAWPDDPPEVGATEAHRDLDGVQGQERARGRRLDRARHDQSRDRADGARGGRQQGVLRLLGAAGAIPERLRHRHADARRADRHRAERG